jgi:putative hemolysin
MTFSVGLFIGLGIIFLLLIISALISGSEVAFFALGPTEINDLQYRSGKIPQTALDLLNQPEKLLATILIANNFVNVGIVILSTWVSHELYDFSGNPILGFVIQTIVITFIILLAGEIIPKVYASRFSLRVVYLMAVPLNTVRVLVKPVSLILIKSTAAVQRRVKDRKRNISLDELSHALELTGEELDEDEKILKGIVKFGNTDVREAMKSRVDVVAVDISLSFGDLIHLIKETGYSRIPVYVNDFDHIKGVLYVKDLLPHIGKPSNFRWQSLIRPPYFVPGKKKIDDLLSEFQKQKIHLALVVDEYGGTSGLITLEDILEEIVGEISDESDEGGDLFTKIDNKTFLFEAKTLLNDFYRVLNIPEDTFESLRGEAETLAGLILQIKGEIPEQKERFKIGDYTFIIEEVDERRISLVKVLIP